MLTCFSNDFRERICFAVTVLIYLQPFIHFVVLVVIYLFLAYCPLNDAKRGQSNGERSGLVEECFTQDRGAACLSLTSVAVLCP